MRFSRKPEWIKVRPPAGSTYNRISKLLRDRELHTVCEEAHCPNTAECWTGGTATLMLMGDTCTRGCRFCAIKTAKLPSALDLGEPRKTAETIALMNLKYVVLTSVDRDDLEDGGASHFANVIRKIHEDLPEVKVESLTSDFLGSRPALETLLASKPEVFAHNLETVRSLTGSVRDPRCGYDLSLSVLKMAKEFSPNQATKSSLMVGLGEKWDELQKAFEDLRKVDVDFLTLGQYLQPSPKHLPVLEFLSPEGFSQLKEKALSFGFRYVAAGPLVRSSYRAAENFIQAELNSRKLSQSLPSLNSEGMGHLA